MVTCGLTACTPGLALGPVLGIDYGKAYTPNGVLIGSAIFAEVTIVTGRLTDHATPFVIIGCIYTVL